jgi:probable biosynthetic protein (TIGR04098 family)
VRHFDVQTPQVTVLETIGAVLTHLDVRRQDAPFEDLGIDSFDLVTLRSALEQKLGRGIPDSVWFGFRALSDIVDFYARECGGEARPAPNRAAAPARELKVNMPQMAAGGLSESWLFKELGDLHWQAICNALGTESDSILDAANNRLYATFVRFRWEGTADLKAFRENERVRIENQLSRYGKSMFFSDAVIEGEDKSIRASLMSAFASRQGGNNRTLLKGEPAIPGECPVSVYDTLPRFSEEYRQFKKGAAQGVELGGQRVSLSRDLISEMEYAINPYQDINGVNLLYFAAYPAIADVCERDFAHRNRERLGFDSDWAYVTATLARDVFYFGNCEIDDILLFRIHSLVKTSGRVSISASLSRKSDRQTLCYIFTVKTLCAS